jgi:hypothetical protein
MLLGELLELLELLVFMYSGIRGLFYLTFKLINAFKSRNKIYFIGNSNSFGEPSFLSSWTVSKDQSANGSVLENNLLILHFCSKLS